MEQRSDGSTATGIGWTLIVIGVFAALFAAAAESPNGFWIGMLLGNLGIGIGVLLCSLGYLVRAIWFLPGREIPQASGSQPSPPSIVTCDYCGLDIAAPERPCSAVSAEELVRIQDRINDNECLALLRERAILPQP